MDFEQLWRLHCAGCLHVPAVAYKTTAFLIDTYAWCIQIGVVMNMKDFADRMKTVISDALKKEVRVVNPLKPNGVRLYGLSIIEPDSNISPVIYLESFFERFLDTDNWTETVKEVLAFYHDSREEDSFDTKWFYDFSQVRENLYYRLINYEANQELLSMVPYTRFLDLAKIYYADCQIGEATGSILIYHRHVEKWNITEDELIAAAEENTPRLYPANIHPLSDFLGLGDDIDMLSEIPVPMYILSNTENRNGAAAVCYRDVLEDFSEKIKDDLVVLPSSVHETLLLPLQKSSNMDSMREMVYDVNRTELNKSEFLSDNVYLYNRQNRQLIIT